MFLARRSGGVSECFPPFNLKRHLFFFVYIIRTRKLDLMGLAGCLPFLRKNIAVCVMMMMMTLVVVGRAF